MGAVILAFAGCVTVIGSASDTSKSAKASTTAEATVAQGQPTTAPAPPKSGPKIAPAGSEVRDGKFAFVVTSVDSPATAVGSGMWKATAKGQFIVVHVDITNVGNEPRGYFDDNQKLYDDQGRQFANDSKAAMGLNTETYVSDLNPGFKLSVQIVFDVPPGTVPASIELHDSMFSGGTRVALK
ncbi:DUF4352 domain-containing protein [Nocardia sp. NPDC049707]|uniref:DUF4352 domain-containing protein n=1 Tax=Nocardia sp. NPDC049707 TaxID=3154735 RepID=UPI0034260084